MQTVATQGDVTTDAVAISGARFTPLADRSYRVRVNVIGRGDNGGRLSVTREGLVSNNGGTVVADVVGSTQNLSAGTVTGWAVTPALDNGDVVVNLKGAAGVRVSWSSEIEVLEVGTF